MPKILVGLCGGATNAHTTVVRRPAKVMLDTKDGGVWTAQCQIILFGLWGGAIPLYPIGQQRYFWVPGMVVFELHNPKNIA